MKPVKIYLDTCLSHLVKNRSIDIDKRITFCQALRFVIQIN